MPTLNYINTEKSINSNNFELLGTDHLNNEEKTEFRKLIKKFPNLFYQQDEPLTFTNLVKHKINLTDEVQYILNPLGIVTLNRKKYEDKLTKQNVIKHSHSPRSAPVFLVSEIGCL